MQKLQSAIGVRFPANPASGQFAVMLLKKDNVTKRMSKSGYG